jgi:hypothetical protein
VLLIRIIVKIYNTTNYKSHEPAPRIQYNSTHPDAGYPDGLGPSGKFVEISTKITWLEITDQVQYSVMAYRTSNQALSIGLGAGTYCG